MTESPTPTPSQTASGTLRDSETVQGLRLTATDGRSDEPVQQLEPLLVGRFEAAALAGIPLRSWDRLTSRAANPRPLHVGRRIVWRRRDIEFWIEIDCPPRPEFEARLRSGK